MCLSRVYEYVYVCVHHLTGVRVLVQRSPGYSPFVLLRNKHRPSRNNCTVFSAALLHHLIATTLRWCNCSAKSSPLDFAPMVHPRVHTSPTLSSASSQGLVGIANVHVEVGFAVACVI